MPLPTHDKAVQQRRWHRFSDITQLELAVADQILRAAQNAIELRGAFSIVLAGGTTPRKVYAALRNAQTDWRAWHVYFGDERCLPSAHEERNSHMAALAWLEHVSIPKAQIHTIPAQDGAHSAAEKYAHTIDQLGTFDMVLLGLGEDGHTASLFPGHDVGEYFGAPVTLAVLDAPKPPPQRVTLSARRLSDTRRVIFMVTGASKVQAVSDWCSGILIPAAAITPPSGVDIYIESTLMPQSD